ncbi:MAG TPA: SLC13 family permease [Thermoanaerobaculia bacterium]|nr:SLC13 family permease [Thermoanaerobaculia bacterium]
MQTLGRFLREQLLVAGAAVLAAAFLVSGRITAQQAAHAIDYDVLLVLFALLITVEVLRKSGILDLVVERTVARFSSTRPFVAVMIVISGALAALMTNDVTLFVVIPFTVIAGRISDFDVEDAVVLEVIATNLLGCLTPLGNPQNLFVYHRSGWSAGHFIATMLPFVGLSAVGLLLAIFLLPRSETIEAARVDLPPRDAVEAIIGGICFTLVLLEIAHVAPAWIAAVCAAIGGFYVLRRRIFQIDLSIVPLFFFAFIVVEGLRSFDLAGFLRGNTYVVAVLLSQVISNVPATVLMTPFAEPHWRELLYGVSAGGCGTIIASLANLLAWRIYVRESNRDQAFFWRLTAINFAFLAWAGLAGWWLLL